MSARYLGTTVGLDAAARVVHVEFEIRNESQETWRQVAGFGVGYHLFDAESGTLLVDGARVRPERDVKPGESARVRLDIEFPEEDGHYHVLV